MEYQILYTRLFNAVTDSICAMEQQNYGIAAEILKDAQQQCEEMYISQAEARQEALVPPRDAEKSPQKMQKLLFFFPPPVL